MMEALIAVMFFVGERIGHRFTVSELVLLMVVG